MAKNEGGKGKESESVEKNPLDGPFAVQDQTTRSGDALTGLDPDDRERQMSGGYDTPQDEDDTEKK